MAGVDGKRGEDGENIPAKHVPGPIDAGGVQLLHGAKINLCFGKGGKKSFMEKAVLVAEHPKDTGPDGGEDFVRVESIRSGNIVAGFDELF
jgi:hypothetical protein